MGGEKKTHAKDLRDFRERHKPSEAMILNHKACGVQGRSPGGVCGELSPPPKKISRVHKFMYNFFFISGQIYMKEAECAESNEKSV